MTVSVAVHDKQPLVVAEDEDALRQLLQSAQAEAAKKYKLNVVILESSIGNKLGIVLGGTDSVLTFTRADNMPPYLISRGTTEDVEPVLTCYVGLEHHTEFPRWSVVPLRHAMQGAMEFLSTGLPPRCIEWKDD